MAVLTPVRLDKVRFKVWRGEVCPGKAKKGKVWFRVGLALLGKERYGAAGRGKAGFMVWLGMVRPGPAGQGLV